VGLSRLIILAGAIPAVAQNHATIGRSGTPLPSNDSSFRGHVWFRRIRRSRSKFCSKRLKIIHGRCLQRVEIVRSGPSHRMRHLSVQSALRLDGQNWPSHYNLGLALLTKGDRSHAPVNYKLRFDSNPISASISPGYSASGRRKARRSRKGIRSCPAN